MTRTSAAARALLLVLLGAAALPAGERTVTLADRRHARASQPSSDSVRRVPCRCNCIPVPPMDPVAFDDTRVGFSCGCLLTVDPFLDGLAIAPIANVAVKGGGGWQLAGGGNVAVGSYNGFQTAFGLNVATLDLVGLQAAGGLNFCGGALRGAQVAYCPSPYSWIRPWGGVNWCRGSLSGAQVSTWANVCGGTVAGLQASLLGNAAVTGLRGLQVGGGNYAGQMTGSQVGFVNVCREGRGAQVGVLNVAGRMSGAAVGLVSLAGNSRFMLDGWVDETAMLNLGLRTSVGMAHNVYFAGAAPLTQTKRFAVGAGFGTTVRVGGLLVLPDVTGAAVFIPGPPGARGTMARVRLMAGWRPAPGVLVYAGPVWTTMTLSSWHGFIVPPLSLPFLSGDGVTRNWLGFSYGIRLFGE